MSKKEIIDQINSIIFQFNCQMYPYQKTIKIKKLILEIKFILEYDFNPKIIKKLLKELKKVLNY